MPPALEQACGQGPVASVGAGADVDGSRGWCRHLASASATPRGWGITVETAHRAARPCSHSGLSASAGGGRVHCRGGRAPRRSICALSLGEGVHQRAAESRAGDGSPLSPRLGLGGGGGRGGPAVARGPAPRRLGGDWAPGAPLIF